MFGMRMNLYSRANDAARPSGEARPDAPLPTRLQSVGPAHRVARPTSLIPGPGAVYPTRAPPAAAGTSKIPAPPPPMPATRRAPRRTDGSRRGRARPAEAVTWRAALRAVRYASAQYRKSLPRRAA